MRGQDAQRLAQVRGLMDRGAALGDDCIGATV